MKKKVIHIVLLFFMVILLLAEGYIRIEYDVGMYQYFTGYNRLTKQEAKWLKDHGSIIYGADNNSPPLRYVDHESKQYEGLAVDYLRALSIEIGAEIEFEPHVWNDALKELEEGRTDICDMYPSEKRGEKYLFSDPIYYQRGVVLVKNSENSIKNHMELSGGKVAAQEGDYAVDFLKQRVSQIDFEFTDDYLEAMNLLKDSKVDAVVGDEPVISYFMQQLNMKDGYKMLDKPLYEKECVLALPKTERTFLNIINKGIYNLKKKDTMVKIQQKWFGISRPIVKDKAPQRFMLIIAFFMAIISMASYLFTVWNKELKNQVEKRTRELDRSKKDLEITFDGLPHFMVVLNDNCNIVSTNKSFCDFKKQYKYEMIGKSCMHFNGIINMDCSNCIVKRTFSDGQHYSKEITFEEKLYEINTFHLDDDRNSKQRVLVMIRDITKIRISEQQLLQSNKMAAVGQLAAGVAHEIRNPLGVIRNYCYVLKNNINQGLDDKAKPIVVIEKSVKKIAGIIDNLLNFSRITDDDIADIDLETFIRNVLELNSKLMDRHNIKTDVVCSGKMYLNFNEEALKHVLINLISNAVDAMPDGGTLTLICNDSLESTEISCVDTGNGINEEDLKNIFNPFFTTKPPGEGTGLGLFIAYTEMEKFGGKIEVSSEIGKGSEFKIVLPKKEGKSHGK